MLLIQNLLHRQELDDPAGSLDFGELSRAVERGAFVFGVFGVAEADEETALAAAFAFSRHDGFESVDLGRAYSCNDSRPLIRICIARG